MTTISDLLADLTWFVNGRGETLTQANVIAIRSLLGDQKPDKGVADGGVAAYYDFPEGYNTLNDLLEWKGDTQWKGDSFHLANLTKAAWRWGIKEGVDKSYDARKIIYSGARLLQKVAGRAELRRVLQQMLDDKQFKEDAL